MIEFMLDTDSCIYLINRHPKMQRKAPPNACGISVIVLGELERAALLSTRPEPTMEFINRITPVDLTDDDLALEPDLVGHNDAPGRDRGGGVEFFDGRAVDDQTWRLAI